jgi:uncharacterized membrane protein YbhN (UPF0104 family)
VNIKFRNGGHGIFWAKSGRVLVALTVIAAFVVYFALNADKFRPLLHIKLIYLLLAVGLNMAAVFVNGLFTKAILIPFGKHISTGESFYVSLISSVGNFFAPAGAGFGIRAVYLKKKFNLAYSDFMSTLAGNYIIVFLVDSLFGLIALWFLRDRIYGRYYLLLIVLLIIFISSLILSLLRIKIPRYDHRNRLIGPVARNLGRVINGWSNIIKNKPLMLELTGITILNVTLTLVLMAVIISSLGFSISFAGLVLFTVLSSLSLFINITPANLGVKEAVYLFSSGVLGFSASQILSIALIDRGVFFVVLLVLWTITSKTKRKFSSIQDVAS